MIGSAHGFDRASLELESEPVTVNEQGVATFGETAWKLAKSHPYISAFMVLFVIGTLAPKDQSARIASNSSTLASQGADGGCNADQRDVSQRFIQAWGYRCDTLNFCHQGLFGSVRVTCNGHHYAYRLRDKGGNWTVELD